MSRPKIFRYRLNQGLRRVMKAIMRFLTVESSERRLDLRNEEIKKILLVRATFRMGDSVLAAPAIRLFRQRFPDARIDFVGGPISRPLFRGLPVDGHFPITRRVPNASWTYLALVKQIRSVKYDLAVDVSCSQSAMGAFLVGFSGARFRAGLKGQWDRWFNVRIPRPREKSKYKILPAFLAALGLRENAVFPSLVLSPAEQAEGKKRMEGLAARPGRPVVGIFVGGRQAWKKRWPIENFCRLGTALYRRRINVVMFLGPEERDLMGFFSDAMGPEIPIIFEPSPRNFSAMVWSCDLFITCDSGPMHLACALGTRTLAIFQHPNFERWGPLPAMGKSVYEPGGCSYEKVLEACLAELPGQPPVTPVASDEKKASRKLEKSVFMHRLCSLRTYTQAAFCLALIAYAWLFPPGLFEDGTWMEAFTTVVGIGSIAAGGFLRLWAVSHGGKLTRSRLSAPPGLIATGPYAYIRHPIFLANFIIGLGLVSLSEAFYLLPVFLALFFLQHLFIVSAEEDLLREKLGAEFDRYALSVPRYIPLTLPKPQFSFGKLCPANELAVLWGIMAVGFFFEWIESPLHRGWVVSAYEFFIR